MPEHFVVVTWLHTCDHLYELQSLSRDVRISNLQIVADVIRNAWADLLGRRSVYLFPVEPPPLNGFNQEPHFLVTAFKSDTQFPTLVDCMSPFGFFRGTKIVRVMQQTMPARWLFEKVLPTNQCVWQTDCSIFVNTRQLFWESV